ncbi:MAG: AlkZ-related protein [bacterium]
MACRVVTEDFVYPTDRHGNRYGWGWALLTTPERLFGRDACVCSRTPEESLQRLCVHLHSLLPEASEKQILKLIA